MLLKQIIPPEYCSKCDVCCRFLDNETPLAPVGLSVVSYNDRFTQPFLDKASVEAGRAGFICQNFNPSTNKCRDYENRPLDCQIYPFVVMWDKEYRNVVLGVDPKCPYIECHKVTRTQSHKYTDYLISILKDIEPKYITRFQDDVEILGRLDIKAKPTLNKLLIGDKELFEKYADRTDRFFSTYSFIANYVWSELLDYYWVIIDDHFCLFCKTKDTFFMPIPPLGKAVSKKTVVECFKLMNELNKNKSYTRIEDISQNQVKFFDDLGYEIKEKGHEYICEQKGLTDLTGDSYKAKRALCNYFEKNYKFDYRKFRQQDRDSCLALFRIWQASRAKEHAKDDYYKALAEDSYNAHKKAMERFRDLELAGRVVVVDNKVSAYTFGYQLDDETFVVLFEVADLTIKGLSQFIFREFCKNMNKYKYINLMDDSGLENLKKVKLSYHPVKVERTFCAYA